MKIEIKKCDICGAEERSDGQSKYWANYHSGKIEINFKSAPSVQSDYSKEHLCNECAVILSNIISDAIEFIKSEKTFKQNVGGQGKIEIIEYLK